MGQGWVNAPRVPGGIRDRAAGTQLCLLMGVVMTAGAGFGDGAVKGDLNTAWG